MGSRISDALRVSREGGGKEIQVVGHRKFADGDDDCNDDDDEDDGDGAHVGWSYSEVVNIPRPCSR